MSNNGKSFKENGPRLATFKRSDTEEQRLNWSSYERHHFLQFSAWHMDDQGIWRAAKTLSIRRSELRAFRDALDKAIELADAELIEPDDDDELAR